jgi:catechol 2,3-dioxygenase-like lactoylglutathione lyase family enzyme
MVKLDHCNIRTFDLEATVAFYKDILDLKEGAFPGDRKLGAWLYDSTDRAVLHIIGVNPAAPETAFKHIRARLGDLAGELSPATLKGGGAIDHIAFECADFAEMKGKLQARGLTFTENDIPSIGLKQLFANDPSGVTLEMNFRATQ